ncbi:hypothetical protein J2S70_001619 [Trueperella bonasi]|uniref:Uncharacterized protein n=1 Tax=Trueperella bonasi TaxID=312286 RepID=A0ABT9NI26_9ACTO|nr:hypothetical protein [Trueperella bonasi]MDP9807037.1 hypothetical protein [Trueperella bonasi]
MENVGVDNVSQSTPLASAPQFENAWIDRHIWYHATPEEVPTTEAAVELISHLARHDIDVTTMPGLSADDDPDYVAAVMERAGRRGIVVLPDVSAGMFAVRGAAGFGADERFGILSQWFEKGARGVDLGTEEVSDGDADGGGRIADRGGSADGELAVGGESADSGGHVHAGWDVRELQAWVKFTDDDAVLSINFRGPSFDAVADHALDDYFDVVRFEVASAPQLDAANYSQQALASFQMFRAGGTLPSWNATWEVLDRIPGRLSRSALLLATCYMPGMIHFEKDVQLQSPSTRHALRFRESLGMYKANILIDTAKVDDGFVFLANDHVTMLLNFGPHPYEIPNDGRVLVSSMIALPENGPNLVVPPGEAAWIWR